MRPKVIVNCAMSADGKIAIATRRQTPISNELDLIRVHQLRQQADAILVGIGTVLADDPKLTVKAKYVKNPRRPLRIVVDSNLRIPRDAQVLNNSAPTLIATTKGHRDRCETVPARVIECGEAIVDLKELLEMLLDKGIRRLLVEGGGKIIWSMFEQGLVDELHVFIGSMVIGGDLAPTMADGRGARKPEDIVRLELKSVERLGDGVVLSYSVLV